MNIPEKIRVLHQTYRISEVDNLHDGADDLYGQVRYLEERILLNSGASDETKKAALMHETIAEGLVSIRNNRDVLLEIKDLIKEHVKWQFF